MYEKKPTSSLVTFILYFIWVVVGEGGGGNSDWSKPDGQLKLVKRSVTPTIALCIKKKAIHSSDRASVHVLLIHYILTHHIPLHIHVCIVCCFIIYFQLLLLLLLPSYLHIYIYICDSISYKWKRKKEKWAHVKTTSENYRE
jgi:hypothetical protein